MASRRKKKRNRQLQFQDQNGLMPDCDPDVDAYPQAVSSDRYEASHDASANEQRQPNETTSATTDSGPPSLPKHDLSGPHIKFPANAKRKPVSTEEGSDKEVKEASEKRPNLLRFWRKKDRQSDTMDSDGDASKSSKPAKPPKPTKQKASKKAMKIRTKKFDDDLDREVEDPFTAPKKLRWRSRLLWLFLMLAVLIFALPWIVTKTPLLNVVISMATGKLNGTVDVQSVSCSWFSGITVTELDVKDQNGNTVLEVPSIEGDRSLLSLLWDRSNLGTFRIEKPIVHVVFGPDGSTNVQELITGYLEEPSEGEPSDLTVEVTGAKVTLAAAPSATPEEPTHLQTLVTLTGVDVSLKTFADPDAKSETQVTVSGSVDGINQNPKVPPTPEDLQPPHDPSEPADSSMPGTFEAELALGRENRLMFDAHQIVLDRFSPLLAKVASGLTVKGDMTGRIDCRWGKISVEGDKESAQDQAPNQEDLIVETNLNLNRFSATGGLLGTDRLYLDRPELACRLSGKNGVYVLRQANLKSEVATLNLDGQVVIDTNVFTGTETKSDDKSSQVMNQTFQLDGWIDLKRLAKMLPATLHLHEELTVQSGKLTLKAWTAKDERLAPLASGKTPIVWNAHVQISDVVGTRHDQRFDLYPITLTLQAHEADGVDVVVDQLICESSNQLLPGSRFLLVKADGHRNKFNAGAFCDLKPLMNQLGAFVDLGGLQMQGQVTAYLDWRRDGNQAQAPNALLGNNEKTGDNEEFTLYGNCKVRNLVIQTIRSQITDLVPVGDPSPTSWSTLFKQPWHEPFVKIGLVAKGRMPSDGPISLEKESNVQITVGSERNPDTSLAVALTLPVEEVSTKTVWPVHVTARGQIAPWVNRVHAMGIAADWQAQGFFSAEILGNYRPEAMKFDSVTVDLQDIKAQGSGVFIDEPQIQLTLSGYYNQLKSQLIVSQATCQTSRTTLTAKELIAAFPDKGPIELTGTLGVDGELGQIQSWITDPRQTPSWFCAGHLTGKVNLIPKTSPNGEILAGHVEATVQPFIMSQNGGYKFTQEKLTVTADGAYDLASSTIDLSDAQLASNVLSGQIQGRLLAGNDPIEADLSGTITCNTKELSTLLFPYVGPDVKLQGTSESPVKLVGPMTLEAMYAQAGIGWDSGDVYGFKLGQGRLDFSIEKGLLDMAPLKMKVNDGQVNLTPKLRVSPEPMLLDIQPGTIIDNVQINRQICENGLKYIAPVLANVAQAEGRFSLAIDQCHIPIDNPKMSQASGRLTIHDMKIDSPFIKQFASVLQRATSASLQKQSTVNFRMANGWVYHEGLELVFPEITIKTRGYVGLDQRLKLVAEMPIPQKWIQNTGGSIRTIAQNEVIRLPIAGTLSKPQLDQKALDKEMLRILGNAGKKEGMKFLNNQINRFLPSR